MAFDPKIKDEGYNEKYIEILQDSSSEETQKARRNTSLISFVIIGTQYLNIQWSELRVFGVNLATASNENKIIIITLILSIFWTIMFLVNHLRDYQIYKIKLNNYLYKYETALEELEDLKELRHLESQVKALHELETLGTSNEIAAMEFEELYLTQKELLTLRKNKEKEIFLLTDKLDYEPEHYRNSIFMKTREGILEQRTSILKDFLEKEFNPTNKLSKTINAINIVFPILLFAVALIILLNSLLSTPQVIPFLNSLFTTVHSTILLIESLLTTLLLTYCFYFNSIYQRPPTK